GAKAELFASSFFPAHPKHLSPKPLQDPMPEIDDGEITKEQLLKSLQSAKAYGAPGPSGIPNVALQSAEKFFTDTLYSILMASLRIRYYPQRFRIFKTIVLRKPGRSDYTIAKSYRPIALQETMGKVIEATMARHITGLLEDNDRLPQHHYRG
ncbi:hypothetical protein BDZ89DRAFT_921417, partial [Hymenopellis radicata]